MVIYTQFKGVCLVNSLFCDVVDQFIDTHRWNSDLECFQNWKDFLKDHNLVFIRNEAQNILQPYWRWKHDEMNLLEVPNEEGFYIEYMNLPPLSEYDKEPKDDIYCVFDKEKREWSFAGKVVDYDNQVHAFYSMILSNICDDIITWDVKEIVIQ
jgi:hypothetical protein